MKSPADHAARSLLRWRPLWLVLGGLLVATVVLLSVVRLPVTLPPAQADKSGHVLAYAVLMFWYGQLYARRGHRLVIAAGLFLLGCGLEVVQQAVGRDFEYADMFADAVGILLGWLASPPRTPHLLSYIETCFVRKMPPQRDDRA